MMTIYRTGGSIGKNNTPTQSLATGMWTMGEVDNFTRSGIWPTLTVEYLVIAGGGGGGSSGANYCGGGGAGGYRCSVIGENTGGGGSAESVLSIIRGTTYSVTVGNGGGAETNGSDSIFGSITSTGGGAGRGSAYATAGFSGGSGGGGTAINGIGGAASSPTQGWRGGVASSANQAAQDSGAGGGGGAGGYGMDPTSPGIYRNNPGDGGIGLYSSITGSSIVRAAGGSGSGYYLGTQTNSIGGASSGFSGGVLVTPTRTGTVNTGSGGGGGRSTSGFAGGSGIVIIRYLSSHGEAVTTTGTVTTTTSGGYRIYTWTTGTGTIIF